MSLVAQLVLLGVSNGDVQGSKVPFPFVTIKNLLGELVVFVFWQLNSYVYNVEGFVIVMMKYLPDSQYVYLGMR